MSMMASKHNTEPEQASAQTVLSLDATIVESQNPNNSSHVGPGDISVLVVVELLRKVPSLSSEEPGSILRLVNKLDEIHSLGLINNKVFRVRIYTLVSGAVLR